VIKIKLINLYDKLIKFFSLIQQKQVSIKN